MRPSLSCARAREPCYSIIVLLCSTLISASSPESNLRPCLAHTHLSLPLVLRRTLCLSFRRQSKIFKDDTGALNLLDLVHELWTQFEARCLTFRGCCRLGPA